MKIGHWLYIIVLISQLILMALPGSTTLLRMSLSNYDNLSWHMLLIDFLAIIITITGYVVLKLIYKPMSNYVKIYPYFALSMAILWSIVVQLK